MPGFIFEGPDGAGKSFTALEVSRAVDLPIHHAGAYPLTPGEMLRRIADQLLIRDKIIDRYSIISEHIYGPIIRNTQLVSEYWFTQIHLPVIYCRPSLNTILSVKLESKPHKNKEHTDKVKEKIVKIVGAYDELMCKIPHVLFNRDEQTVEELCHVLQKMN